MLLARHLLNNCQKTKGQTTCKQKHKKSYEVLPDNPSLDILQRSIKWLIKKQKKHEVLDQDINR